MNRRCQQGARTAIDIFVRKSAAIAAQLKRHPFVAGHEFTAADISCGYAAGFGRFLGIEDRLDPAIPDYYRRLTERPVVSAGHTAHSDARLIEIEQQHPRPMT